MSEADRLISPDKRGEDLDAALRPQTLDDFTGLELTSDSGAVQISACEGSRPSFAWFTLNIAMRSALTARLTSSGSDMLSGRLETLRELSRARAKFCTRALAPSQF
mgnify:CR=1 FL=1